MEYEYNGTEIDWEALDTTGLEEWEMEWILQYSDIS
jgi:hypothetical protein